MTDLSPRRGMRGRRSSVNDIVAGSLRILGRLRHGPAPVGELAADIGMEQSAVSHQLRMLRHLGLVTGQRTGRTVVYALFDSHVAMLLDEAVYHTEHLRLGVRDTPAADVQVS